MNEIEDRPAALITGKGIHTVADGVGLPHGQGHGFVADVGGGLLVFDCVTCHTRPRRRS
ncbi:hypothetical protein [Cupriavidus basilensis]|nr:hypothetical protein [Cupriavidus basilensis]